MDRKYMIKLLGIVTVCYVAMSFIIMTLSDLNRYENNYLDQFITGTVVKSDGTVIEYDSNIFGYEKQGDTLIATIRLPKEFYIKDSSICFHVYNSVIRLYHGDRLLYEYGEDLNKKGKMIGGVFARVIIPEEAWGDSLRLVCEITENRSVPDLKNVMVIETVSSIKYFLVGHVTEFIVYIAIMLITSMLLLILLFYGRWTSPVRKAIYLCGYCCFLAIWIMSSNGMYNLIVGNDRYFANAEYWSIFISPIPILLFLYEEQENEVVKRRYRYYTIGYTIFFVIATILNYATRDFHYARLMIYLHTFFIFMVFLVVKEVFFSRNAKNISSKMLRFGIGFTMAVLCLELIHHNLEKYYAITWYETTSISALAVLIMLVTITSSYSAQLAQSIIDDREKQYLKEMAVVDGLTGLANRAGCYEYLESMELRNCKTYTIIYFDLNNLKPLNDTYGHDYGDKLILFLARQLKENFVVDGFCGRLGGDEFIGIVEYGGTIHVPECINRISKEFRRANKRGEFPMEVSVSFGIAKSTSEEPLDIMNALRRADLNMYETKKRYKEKK